jgi:hypothetical protein
MLLFGCGGGSPGASYAASERSAGGEAYGAPQFEVLTASTESEEDEADSDDEYRRIETASVRARAPSPAPPPAEPGGGGGGDDFAGGPTRQLAQVDRPQQQAPTKQPRQAPDDPATATDATDGPLLIYQAILHLAVYQVQDNQRAVVAIAREMGGFLANQSDTIVVIRVPVRKFQEALGRIEGLGDVLHRNIQATDVSEEFRDTQIRLRNLEQVRDRLAQLLNQARTVEESLQIERELERLTTAIESMKGRLRFLEDRISFSTITVNFAPREQETLQGELFNLPFDFLYNLGLRTLLNLR